MQKERVKERDNFAAATFCTKKVVMTTASAALLAFY
jgi:hypothetical protein